MITSTKNYTKKKPKTDRQNPRTKGKSKAIQTKSHTEAYTYTLTKREKGNIYKRKRANKQINPPMIISTKYYTKINIKPETN